MQEKHQVWEEKSTEEECADQTAWAGGLTGALMQYRKQV